MIQIISPIKKALYHEGKIKLKFSESDLLLHHKIGQSPAIRTFLRENGKTIFDLLPLTINIVSELQELKFIFDPQIISFIDDHEKNIKELANKQITGLKANLFPYQKEGFAFIEKHNGNVLLADEMGLGKSLQTIAYVQNNKLLRPVIIVCPASLKLNWEKEFKLWTNENKIQILNGSKIMPIDANVIIINYDILSSWVDELRKINAKILILDECHVLKNSSAQRTKATKKLAKGIEHIIAISGTPILNRPSEIYNSIKLVNPLLFPDFKNFQKRYCGLRYNGFGWEANGATHIPELHKILKENIMIRRLKKDVLTDLPDKLYSFVPIALTNKIEYRNAEDDFIAWVEDNKGAEAAMKANSAISFTKTEGLKQLAVEGKLKNVGEWIADFLETGQKLVVFAVHQKVISYIMELFKEVAVKIDGSTSQKERNKNVESFQNDDKVRLFVGNIQAAGVGLNLTKASSVAFIEYPWSPGLLNQAQDRCHRIGQKDNVTIYYLLAQNTIEEKIALLLDKKRKVLDSVMDGGLQEEQSLITELIKMYEQPKLNLS